MFISDANYRDIDSRALVADDFIRVHEQPLYCKTKEEILQTWGADNEKGYYEEQEYENTITTHKAIVDDKGNIVSIVGQGYNVVQNADIIPD